MYSFGLKLSPHFFFGMSQIEKHIPQIDPNFLEMKAIQEHTFKLK